MKFNEKKLSPGLQAVILIFLVGLLLIGISIIVLPRYLEHMANNHQHEAIRNLRKIYMAERNFHQENARYAGSFDELGFRPSGKYTYYLGEVCAPPEDGNVLPLPGDVASYVNNDKFQAVALSNMDEDKDLDTWTVDEKGQMTHVVNDFDKPHLKDYPSELRHIIGMERVGGRQT
ncbi:MAG: hypothetical protein ABSG42_06290 [Nitrospirota bacterium]